MNTKKVQKKLKVGGVSWLVEAEAEAEYEYGFENLKISNSIFREIPGSVSDYNHGCFWSGVKKEELIFVPSSVLKAAENLIKKLQKKVYE